MLIHSVNNLKYMMNYMVSPDGADPPRVWLADNVPLGGLQKPGILRI